MAQGPERGDVVEEERRGLVCMVCKEGYASQPAELLAAYCHCMKLQPGEALGAVSELWRNPRLSGSRQQSSQVCSCLRTPPGGKGAAIIKATSQGCWQTHIAIMLLVLSTALSSGSNVWNRFTSALVHLHLFLAKSGQNCQHSAVTADRLSEGHLSLPNMQADFARSRSTLMTSIVWTANLLADICSCTMSYPETF